MAGILYVVISLPRFWMGVSIGLAPVLIYWIYNFMVFIYGGIWAPLVLPTFVYAATLVTGIMYRYYIHDREKHQLTNVFSKYVSPQVMDQILADPEKSLDNLSGTRRELTVLFADLQGFTRHFEREAPEAMVNQLNDFFTAMMRVILKHQGTYDKFMGDAVMAFFGAPTDIGNHAAKACAAALEMQSALVTLNAQWEAMGIPPLKLGVGLSTGEMVVGNFGSEDLKNITVMGTPVNLGARLEALTRVVNCPIVISERTRIMAGEAITVRSLGAHVIKGITEPVQVYSLEEPQ